MEGNLVAQARLEGLRVGEVLVPQPVLAEIAFGLERLGRSRRQRNLRRAYETFCSLLARSTWDDRVSETYGQLKARLVSQGSVIEDFDVAIAAHALVEGAVLATENVRHFERVPGLQVESWLRAD